MGNTILPAPINDLDQWARSDLSWARVLPVSVVLPFAGANVPTGFLACNGQLVSRTTFANLYAAIGTTYGAGDGSTTFGLPDLRGRTPIGSGQGAGLVNNYALGQYYGEETHVLSVAEMPTHNHNVTDPKHAHSISDPGHSHFDSTFGLFGGNTVNIYQSGNGTDAFSASHVTGVGVLAASTGISIQNNGSSAAHNNIQPILAMNYIIKT